MEIHKVNFKTSLMRKLSIQQVAGIDTAIVLVVKNLHDELGQIALGFDMMYDTFRDSNSKGIILTFDSSWEDMKEKAEFLGIKSTVGWINDPAFDELKVTKGNTHVLYKFWNKELTQVKLNPRQEHFVKLNDLLAEALRQETENKVTIADTQVMTMTKGMQKRLKKIKKQNEKNRKQALKKK